jgi:pimeloyl-ACP methyl ester carboxylesterase
MMTIVLLPGMDGTGKMFGSLVHALRDEFKILVVPYPDQQPLGYDELTDYVRTQLPNNEQFILLAESFSGPIGLAIAASKPPGLSGLILCCTFASNPIPWSRHFRGLILRFPISLHLLGMMSPLLLGEYSTTPLRRELQEALTGVSKEVLRARLSVVLAVDYSGYAMLNRLPTLYLQATKDRVVPGSAALLLKNLIPQMEVHKINGPHLLLQAVPSDAAVIIQSFVRRIIKYVND